MKTDSPTLPPTYQRKDFSSQTEYEEYLSIERSDIEPAEVSESRKVEIAQVACNTIEKIAGKKIPISLRIPERDVQRAKSLAMQKGIPYQTLISSIVHQYLDGRLVEK